MDEVKECPFYIDWGIIIDITREFVRTICDRKKKRTVTELIEREIYRFNWTKVSNFIINGILGLPAPEHDSNISEFLDSLLKNGSSRNRVLLSIVSTRLD